MFEASLLCTSPLVKNCFAAFACPLERFLKREGFAEQGSLLVFYQIVIQTQSRDGQDIPTCKGVRGE